jgi:hypothetical protein
MEQTEIAWLAGLLEGEGSFQCVQASKARPQSRHLTCTLGMTDEDVVRRAGVLMDAPSIYEQNPAPPRKKVFIIGISGYKAERVMKLILPYMGIRRRDKILKVLADWKTRPVAQRERGRKADCHPDRPNKGHGLCDECHRRKRYQEKDIPMRQAIRAAKTRDFLFV